MAREVGLVGSVTEQREPMAAKEKNDSEYNECHPHIVIKRFVDVRQPQLLCKSSSEDQIIFSQYI